jgi:hypothetical protein
MAGDDEKPQATTLDDTRTVDTATEKHVLPDVAAVDYSGAHEKTDPKEIALVRKLDRYIMVGVFQPKLRRAVSI